MWGKSDAAHFSFEIRTTHLKLLQNNQQNHSFWFVKWRWGSGQTDRQYSSLFYPASMFHKRNRAFTWKKAKLKGKLLLPGSPLLIFLSFPTNTHIHSDSSLTHQRILLWHWWLNVVANNKNSAPLSFTFSFTLFRFKLTALCIKSLCLTFSFMYSVQ